MSRICRTSELIVHGETYPAWAAFDVNLICICSIFRELKKVIVRARPNLIRKSHTYETDPDMALAYYWTEEQVAQWIEDSGYPYLKVGVFV